MALIQSVRVWGFGSFFVEGSISARDIDLLIVHEDLSRASIEFVIRYKSFIVATIPKAHIVMLSTQEEANVEFVTRSKATFLGTSSDEDIPTQIRDLTTRILLLKASHRIRGSAVAVREIDNVVER